MFETITSKYPESGKQNLTTTVLTGITPQVCPGVVANMLRRMDYVINHGGKNVDYLVVRQIERLGNKLQLITVNFNN